MSNTPTKLEKISLMAASRVAHKDFTQIGLAGKFKRNNRNNVSINIEEEQTPKKRAIDVAKIRHKNVNVNQIIIYSFY
jgi:hypothetical protein